MPPDAAGQRRNLSLSSIAQDIQGKDPSMKPSDNNATMTPAEPMLNAPKPPPQPLNIIQKTFRAEALARLQRATLADCGFVERLVVFWSNHFFWLDGNRLGRCHRVGLHGGSKAGVSVSRAEAIEEAVRRVLRMGWLLPAKACDDVLACLFDSSVLLSICASPAGISRVRVNVACSRAGSSETWAVWLLPPAATVTESNAISAAFSVIVFAGRSSFTVMRSVPAKVAFARFGSSAMS